MIMIVESLKNQVTNCIIQILFRFSYLCQFIRALCDIFSQNVPSALLAFQYGETVYFQETDN